MFRLCAFVLCLLLNLGAASAQWVSETSTDPFTKTTTHAAATQSNAGVAIFKCLLPHDFGFGFRPTSSISVDINKLKLPLPIISLLIVVDGGEVHRFVLPMRARTALSEGWILLPHPHAVDAAWLVAAGTTEVGFALEIGDDIQNRMVVPATNAKKIVYETLKACGHD
jgi:hypothetical protein